MRKQEAAQVSKVMIPPIYGSLMQRTYEAGKFIYRRIFQGNGEKDESDEVFDEKFNNNEDKKKREGGKKNGGKGKKMKV